MATMPVLSWGICLTSQLKPLAQFNRRQTRVDNRRKVLSRNSRFNLNEVFDAVASLFRPESGRDILKAIADTHARYCQMLWIAFSKVAILVGRSTSIGASVVSG